VRPRVRQEPKSQTACQSATHCDIRVLKSPVTEPCAHCVTEKGCKHSLVSPDSSLRTCTALDGAERRAASEQQGRASSLSSSTAAAYTCTALRVPAGADTQDISLLLATSVLRVPGRRCARGALCAPSLRLRGSLACLHV